MPQITKPTNTMKFIAPLLAATLLAGCASVHEPVPQGHVGPVAIVEDSFRQLSTSKTDFFYVEQVDGHKIDNSRAKSLAANRGAGMRMTPQFEQRNIPASRPTSLTIVARTEYAAPILTLTRSVYEVKGVVDFTPEPGKRYVVRGSLQADRSSVWLEEKESQQVVSKKIEIEGSAKLGIFSK